MRPHTRDGFQIAIVCALPHEADAVKALFDETYDHGNFYGKQEGDTNVYVNGRLGQHHVVLTFMPGMGKGSAAAVAAALRISYPGVKLALVVGICGAVPFTPERNEIVLGDVIISDGVVEYDFGRRYPDEFQRKTNTKDTLGRPNREVRSVLATLRTGEIRQQIHQRTHLHLETLQALRQSWQYPGSDKDILFETLEELEDQPQTVDAAFIPNGSIPDGHTTAKRMHRHRLEQEVVLPIIHIGTVACADTVMKSAKHRDSLVEREGAIAFEMEGAGVWDVLPCIIIKGVCDYADSNKNKQWQDYAAATGAAAAKAFLEHWKPAIGHGSSSMRATNHTKADSNFVRVEGMSSVDKRCLSDLLLTDPRDDKLRLEQTKGGLLRESFCWILDQSEFKTWREDQETQLLWIRGDAGKGKTMLMIGIIDELAKDIASSPSPEPSPILSYFLCQGTNTQLNNATSVIRGLMYLLLVQRPYLLRHLRSKYEHTGPRLFDGLDQFYALMGPFLEMLQDPAVPEVYLLVDAVDECQHGLSQLLDLITHTTNRRSKVKWLLSSRNREEIEQRLGACDNQKSVRLERNHDQITNAIDIFITNRVSRLTSLQRDSDTLARVKQTMHQKSDGTFLWASLVIEELKKGVIAVDALDIVESTPSGLTALFKQMMDRVKQLEPRKLQRCLQILSTAVLAHRPLHLLEMRTIAGLPAEITELPALDDIVSMCGSFLTTRESHVYFIHQSASDYLVMHEARTLFTEGQEELHYLIFQRSLTAMSETLEKDICQLKNPGPLTEEERLRDTPLIPIKYSCVHWFDHLYQSKRLDEYGRDLITSFLNKHLLHWFECLGLLQSMLSGTRVLKRFLDVTTEAITINRIFSFGLSPYVDLRHRLQEYFRLAVNYGPTLNTAPLQVYGAAMLFSPEKSEIKRRFWGERPLYIKAIAGVRKYWNTSLRIPEGHRGSKVNDVHYSPDNLTFATASDDCTVMVSDAMTGFLQITLKAHKRPVNTLAFLDNSETLVSGSDDGTILVWNTVTGRYDQIYAGNESVSTLSFSPGTRTVAAGLSNGTVMLWNMDDTSWRGIFLEKIDPVTQEQDPPNQSNCVKTLAFSRDGTVLGCTWENDAVRIWHTSSETWEDVYEREHITGVLAVSPDGWALALASIDGFLGLWDRKSRNWKHKTSFRKQTGTHCSSISFAPDGQSLLLACGNEVFHWIPAKSNPESILIIGYDSVTRLTAMDYSTNTHALLLGAHNGAVFLWDDVLTQLYQPSRVADGAARSTFHFRDAHPINIVWVLVASFCLHVVRFLFEQDVWSITLLFLMDTMISVVYLIALRPELIIQYTFFIYMYVTAWVVGGHARKILPPWLIYLCLTIYTILPIILWFQVGLGPKSVVRLVITDLWKHFESQDDSYFNYVWYEKTQSHVYHGHQLSVTTMQLSPDGRTLVTGSLDSKVLLWDTATNTRKHCLDGHAGSNLDVRFSPDSRYLVTIIDTNEAKIWDTMTGACLKTFEDKQCLVVFSPDGHTLVSGSYNFPTLYLWDTSFLKHKSVHFGQWAPALGVDLLGVHISANADMLAATCNTSTVKVWDTASTGSCDLEVNGTIGTLALSQDGKFLAVMSTDGALTLWNTSLMMHEYIEVRIPDGKDAKQMAFSQDGRDLAITCPHAIILVDAHSGAHKQTLQARVKDARFSADSRSLVTDKGLVSLDQDLNDRRESLDFRAFSIEEDWVSFNGNRILWLPPEYRASSFAVYNSTLALGHHSGNLTFIEFDTASLLSDQS